MSAGLRQPAAAQSAKELRARLEADREEKEQEERVLQLARDRDPELADDDADQQHADHGADLDARDAELPDGEAEREGREDRELGVLPQGRRQPVHARSVSERRPRSRDAEAILGKGRARGQAPRGARVRFAPSSCARRGDSSCISKIGGLRVCADRWVGGFAWLDTAAPGAFSSSLCSSANPRARTSVRTSRRCARRSRRSARRSPPSARSSRSSAAASTTRSRRSSTSAPSEPGTAAEHAAAVSASPESGPRPYMDIYGFAMLDSIYDFKRVDPDWQSTLRVSKIPVDCPGDTGCGNDDNVVLSVKQSRFGVKAGYPTPLGELFAKFEFDLFATGGNAGETNFRLRKAYGELGPLLAGQTDSVFSDPDVFPNTIDYWGPTGMVFFRNPQLRYTPVRREDLQFAVAIESPGSAVDEGKLTQIDPDARCRGLEPGTGLHDAREADGRLGPRAAGRHPARPRLPEPRLGHQPSGRHGDRLGHQPDLGAPHDRRTTSSCSWSSSTARGIASYMHDGGTDLAPDSDTNPECGGGADARLARLLQPHLERALDQLVRLQRAPAGYDLRPARHGLRGRPVPVGEPALPPGSPDADRPGVPVGPPREPQRQLGAGRARAVLGEVRLRAAASSAASAERASGERSCSSRLARAALRRARVRRLESRRARRPRARPTRSACSRKRTRSSRASTEGKNADYIPALAEVPSNLFGIALVTTDGQAYEVGDSSSPFSIQSISKVFAHGARDAGSRPSRSSSTASASTRRARPSTPSSRSSSTRAAR